MSRVPSEVAGQLSAAGKKGDVEKVASLLAKYPSAISETDALFWACERGHDKLVEFLIAQGADIHRVFADGKSPSMVADASLMDAAYKKLRAAAKVGDAQAAQKWLERYPHLVGMQDRSGNTILFVAAASGRGALVELLVSKGAKTRQKNARGKTPFDVAKGTAISALNSEGATARLAVDIASDAKPRVYGSATCLELCLEVKTACCGWVTDGSAPPLRELIGDGKVVFVLFGVNGLVMFIFGVCAVAIRASYASALCDRPLLDHLAAVNAGAFANVAASAATVLVVLAGIHIDNRHSGVCLLLLMLLYLAFLVILVYPFGYGFVGLQVDAWASDGEVTSTATGSVGCDGGLVRSVRALIIGNYASTVPIFVGLQTYLGKWVRARVKKDLFPPGPYVQDGFITDNGSRLVSALMRYMGSEVTHKWTDPANGFTERVYSSMREGKMTHEIRVRETGAGRPGAPSATRTKFISRLEFEREMRREPCTGGASSLGAAALLLITSHEQGGTEPVAVSDVI